MDYWVIIPDKVIAGIEEKCLNETGKFTISKLLNDLETFVRLRLERLDMALYQYYKDEIDYLNEETLKRALNKRVDRGVYLKKNKKLLDLLCFYAYNKNWQRTLKKFRIDFKNVEIRNSKGENISKELLDEIKSLREEKGDYALILLKKAIHDVKLEMLGNDYITVDVSLISKKKDDIIEYQVSSLKSFSALTNAIYYYLVDFLDPYTYGYDWVLKNAKSNEIYKSRRMLEGRPPGIRMPDLRPLDEVEITKGMHLIGVNLKENENN